METIYLCRGLPTVFPVTTLSPSTRQKKDRPYTFGLKNSNPDTNDQHRIDLVVSQSTYHPTPDIPGTTGHLFHPSLGRSWSPRTGCIERLYLPQVDGWGGRRSTYIPNTITQPTPNLGYYTPNPTTSLKPIAVRKDSKRQRLTLTKSYKRLRVTYSLWHSGYFTGFWR